MTQEQIKKEFKAGELSYIDAIEELYKIGFSSRGAEAIVSEWQEEK